MLTRQLLTGIPQEEIDNDLQGTVAISGLGGAGSGSEAGRRGRDFEDDAVPSSPYICTSTYIVHVYVDRAHGADGQAAPQQNDPSSRGRLTINTGTNAGIQNDKQEIISSHADKAKDAQTEATPAPVVAAWRSVPARILSWLLKVAGWLLCVCVFTCGVASRWSPVLANASRRYQEHVFSGIHKAGQWLSSSWLLLRSRGSEVSRSCLRKGKEWWTAFPPALLRGRERAVSSLRTGQEWRQSRAWVVIHDVASRSGQGLASARRTHQESLLTGIQKVTEQLSSTRALVLSLGRQGALTSRRRVQALWLACFLALCRGRDELFSQLCKCKEWTSNAWTAVGGTASRWRRGLANASRTHQERLLTGIHKVVEWLSSTRAIMLLLGRQAALSSRRRVQGCWLACSLALCRGREKALSQLHKGKEWTSDAFAAVRDAGSRWRQGLVDAYHKHQERLLTGIRKVVEWLSSTSAALHSRCREGVRSWLLKGKERWLACASVLCRWQEGALVWLSEAKERLSRAWGCIRGVASRGRQGMTKTGLRQTLLGLVAFAFVSCLLVFACYLYLALLRVQATLDQLARESDQV